MIHYRRTLALSLILSVSRAPSQCLHFTAVVVICLLYCRACTNHCTQCSWQFFHFYTISTVRTVIYIQATYLALHM
ncbi:hypothetical protein EDB85DRAFT_1968797 [Lactarius pseudohatsudake]|nr:hypothetical protein EDB85DRAFT_1968797 [Lactarius pseudohatsudake]